MEPMLFGRQHGASLLSASLTLAYSIVRKERPVMSRNTDTVNAYLDGFRKNDHAQILSCLTDDITWTVYGAFKLSGKEAYDKAIDGAPHFIDPPELEVVR